VTAARAASLLCVSPPALLDAYEEHCRAMGLSDPAIGERLDGARRFLAAHPDLGAWMSRPLAVRLADLRPSALAWPLVSFAVLSGRLRADFDLLAAKNAGRSFVPAVGALYPGDLAELRAAVGRLQWAEPWARAVLGHGPALVVAAAGRAPLAPDADAALMAAVAGLDDSFARTGLTVLRGCGLRIGELLDLELNCVADYGQAGHWLKVPLGKLNSERSVPLDDATLAAIQDWVSHRRAERAVPHSRGGRMTDFLFTERGRRPGKARIAAGLRDAVRAAGLAGPGGAPLHVTAHMLRHTYATSLANSGMSLQGLMALLGHTTPQMTLRYATLASPALRDAYEAAMGRMRPRLPIAPAGKPIIPGRVEWLHSEMLKTRVAHGYCARELAAEACPYANICETCDNFIPAAEFVPALAAQVTDIRALRDDATARGWASETARHDRVIQALEAHLRRLDDTAAPPH
jgi:integrase